MEPEEQRDTPCTGHSRVTESIQEVRDGEGGVGQGQGQGPSWAEMIPEALVGIFRRLSLREMLTVVPCVCRSWNLLSKDSVCWSAVDLKEWVVAHNPEHAERLIQMLLSRSRGSLKEFSVCGPRVSLSLRTFALSGRNLEVLCIPNCGVTDDWAEQIAPSFPLLIFLDISGCTLLSKKAIEAFGVHCRHILRLNRNLHPSSNETSSTDDEEAFAIANHMPQLKHLELAYGIFTNAGLKAIFEHCSNLECLDLRGCWSLDMEATFIKDGRKRLKVFYQPVVQSGYGDDNDDDDDDDDAEDSLDYDFDSDPTDFDLDFDPSDGDIYEEEIDGTLYFWPD